MTKDDLVNVNYKVENLYPTERDVILIKLKLIKNKFYNGLDYDYSLVKDDINWVNVDLNVPLSIGLKLFEMFKSITFKVVEDENRFVPVVSLSLNHMKEGLLI